LDEEEEFWSTPSDEEEFQPTPLDESEEVQTAPFDNEAVQEEDLPMEEDAVSRPAEEALTPPVAEETAIPHMPQRFPPTAAPLSDTQSLPTATGAVPPFPTVPAELPPFMSRPLEWESTPPTVIGMPPLPAATSFSEHEFVAFKLIEEGKANFERKQWLLAREQFEQAISLAPFLPYSYYFLGRIAFAHGELNHAVAFLQKAELLFPRAERAWLGEITSVKGTVYEDLNDYKQARTAYRRSLRFQPTNLKVLSALARLPEEEPAPDGATVQ
jgi:tetratricopeptide (TPR) repeat protein